MDPIVLFAVPVVGVLALCVAFGLYKWINGNDEGTDRMREIAGFIREGSMAFLRREYRVIGIFTLAMFIVLVVAMDNILTAVAFLVGAGFSLLAGFSGMRTATNSNVRTAAAARSGMPMALKIAFRGGAVMGLCVVGFGALGIGTLLLVFSQISGAVDADTVSLLTGFGLGASSIALFGRVGGGIYTKAADVGADLVGKVEAGIPEDDPRNPAVIADNVGDNVGDVAGMGSDLFESYCGSIIAATVLGATLTHTSALNGIAFPLMIAVIGILASIVCIFLVGGKNSKNPASALNFATYASSAIVLVAAFVLGQMFFPGMEIGSQFGGLGAFAAIAAGVVVGVVVGTFTEFYTSADYKAVKGIAKQSETGPATTIIDGFAVGLISTVGPIIFIALGVLFAHFFAGLYGIALAAVGMLSTTGMVVAVDAYGPIADNAGGIAEMSELPSEVREITDTLDSVGNTTAAIGKGFAIGSAALTALALFVSFSEIANTMTEGVFQIDILNPMVVVGLFLGGVLPFLFGALTMRSVGKAAFEMIEEVRRQFREDKGIMEGTSKPDYARCVSISTGAALKEMIAPGVLAVVAPIATGIILGLEALGGMLAGALVTGVLLAITMANAGGAWDNAKKYIEKGSHGGKGSDAHKAAVVGDTVGDPFKDTSGPAMNILIKLMTIVAVVFLPLFGRFM
ncbi:MAG: sodium-translocating pyrophosphatase [Defluviitaleaceae bacterium]|nr:sodium-translocating pyrophosphatase [Defluviitaleaceae bacterium]